MKKSVIEKTNEHLVKFQQDLNEQGKRRKEFIQRQAKLQKELVKELTQGEKGIRYSKWGMTAGYAVLAGGLVTTLFSPWKGLGVMALGGASILSNHYHIKRLEEKKD